ncbi:hypothetical protein [Streptomyces sp. NBC_01334]|uniref:hypothetical protein n=1 Tax=Streptomyces sp. NBC_01334 TaxID=2903827 RepID=UPI002E0D52F5|nr:hypothetical protein OG736_44570 [Streptomyces sp. NBC_01334]
MSIMQLSPASGDGPHEPRRLTLALAGGYAAGYSAALGLGVNPASDQGGSGQIVTLVLAQGVVAALSWVWARARRE